MALSGLALQSSRPGLVASRYQLDGSWAKTNLVNDRCTGDSLVLEEMPSPIGGSQRRALERLRGTRHPHLVALRDFGKEGQQSFVVCQPYSQLSLRDFARQSDWSRLAPCLADITQALAFLHQHGISHGDLRLECMRVEQGRAQLVGLSAVRLAHGRDSASPLQDSWQLQGSIRELATMTQVPAAVLEAADALCLGTTPRASLLALLASLGRRPEPQILSLPWRTVGRAPELLRTQRVVSGVIAGKVQPRVVWIHGEHGVGRSQLLREVKWRVEELCGLIEGSKAMGIVQTLGLEWQSAELAAHAFAHSGPCVFLLDDVQDMGDAAKAELVRFGRALPSCGKGLLVCASTEPPPAELECLSLRLRGLDANALRDWLCALPLDEESFQTVQDESGGNPQDALFLASELLGEISNEACLDESLMCP